MDAQHNRSFKLGLYIYPGEGWMGGKTPGWHDLKGMAQAAEEMGFDSIWLPDRLHFVLSEGSMGLWESSTMLSALSAITTRVEIGHAVMRSIYRHPSLVAKMAVTMDEISGGRFVLGLGAGSNEGDNHQFGYPTDHPYSRFSEAFHIIYTLLRHGQMTFKGTYYEVNDCQIRPRGARPEGPPILIAAQRPKMMRLAARYADIWHLPVAPLTPEGLVPYKDALDAACDEVGRDPSSIDRMAGLLVNPLSEFSTHPYGDTHTGSPGELTQAIMNFADAGYRHVVLWIYPNSLAALEAISPALSELSQ